MFSLAKEQYQSNIAISQNIVKNVKNRLQILVPKLFFQTEVVSLARKCRCFDRHEYVNAVATSSSSFGTTKRTTYTVMN